MKNPLAIRVAEIGDRLYRALDIPPFWEGRVEERARLTIQAEDMGLPEYWHLRRGSLLVAGASVAASVGNFSGLQLNASASVHTVLGVVEKVLISNTNAAAMNVAVGMGIGAAGPTDITPAKRDDRVLAPFTPGAVSVLIPQTFQAAAAPNTGNCAFVRLAADQTLILEGPWVLTGREVFVVRPSGTNLGIMASIFWRERPLTQTEIA